MTTIQAPFPATPKREFAAIAQRLDAAGSQFRLAEILRALARFLAIIVPCATAVIFLAGIFTLPGWATISF